MSAFDRALDTLRAGIDEIRLTMTSRAEQSDGLTAIAPLVFSNLKTHRHEVAQFQKALKARRVALDSFYRGLFVASVSYFEGFVKSLISVLVQSKAASASKFTDLPESFRNTYTVRSTQVLSNLTSGTVKGIPFNFNSLQSSLGRCFIDDGRPVLDGDVFTILMGNPTWGRLEKVLESLEIEEPFDQSFGSSAALKAWGKAAWAKNLAEAEKKLNSVLDQRNLIVHAASPVAVVERDVSDACDFFEALANALTSEMRTRV